MATVAGRLLGIFWLVTLPSALLAQQPPQFRTGNLAPILDPPASAAAAPAPAPAAPQFRTAQPTAILDPPPGSGSSGAGFTGTEGLTTIPSDPYSFQQEPPPITGVMLFRNTQFPNGPLITPPALGPNIQSESLSGEFKLSLPSFAGGIPFLQRGFEPQDADLKIGPFYFKLVAAQAAVLYSDNINLTPVGQSGTIAYMGLTVEVMAQITESLQISTAGTFVYLPIQGEAGIAGFGINDFYSFGLYEGPIAHAQASWDTQIAGWHVVFMDNFEVGAGIYSNDIRSDDALFKGFDNNDQAQTGRYVLRPATGALFGNSPNQNDQFNNFNDDIVVYDNTISADVDRLLPGSIRLQARVYQDNLWYNQGNRGLPYLRDGAEVGLFEERENMRFKPYFIYEAFHDNEFSGVQSIFRLGVRGPITDQLQFAGEVGYFSGGLQGSGELWSAQLDHVAGPYTTESLFYGRTFNYFHDEIDESIGYEITQILGPKLTAGAFALRNLAQYSYSNAPEASDEEYRFGLTLVCVAGPKTALRFTGEVDTFDPEHSTTYLGRAELDYTFTDTLFLQFVYQYQQSRSSLPGLNYQEDLFFLSLTKYFR